MSKDGVQNILLFEVRMRNLVILGLLSGLAACGSNTGSVQTGSSSVPSQTPGAISGTAAIGAPMANAKVKIEGPQCKGALAKVSEANAKGVYSVALAGCEGPFLISAESAAGKIFSVATEEDVGKIVNVTPLTQVVATRVLGTTTLEGLDINAQQAKVTKTSVDQSVSDVQTALSSLASAFGASNIDIRSGAFAADGSKLDKVLDAVSVQPSGVNLQIAVKGATGPTTVVTIPADSAAPVTGSIDAAAVTAATQAMTEFDSMKSNLITGINACLKSKNESCYSGFFHTSYKHDGMVVADEWEDIYWEGMDLQYTDINLITMNATKDEAWISYRAIEKQEDGEYRGWLGVNKLKKESSSWKIFGNQIPHKFHPQSSIIQDGAEGNLKRGVNFRYWDWAAIPDQFSFTFESSDLGVNSPISVVYNGVNGSGAPVDPDGVVYFSVANGTPNCAGSNKHCENFLVIPNSQAVLFPRYVITINSVEYESYLPALPPIPVTRTDAPKFENLAHDTQVCGSYAALANFPAPLSSLSWTLPTGFSVEGVNFNNKGAYDFWDFNYNLDFTDTTTPFGSGIQASQGSFDITNVQLRLEFRDDKDRAFFIPYSCSTI